MQVLYTNSSGTIAMYREELAKGYAAVGAFDTSYSSFFLHFFNRFAGHALLGLQPRSYYFLLLLTNTSLI